MEEVKASEFFDHIDDIVAESEDTTPALLYCRVSQREQGRIGKSNLKSQDLGMRVKTTEKFPNEIQIIDSQGFVESGWRTKLLEDEMWGLEALAKRAVEINAVILAESVSRLVRGLGWTTENWRVTPSREEYEFCISRLHGARVATLLHPDTSPEDEKVYQIWRGKLASERKGAKKRRRTEMFPLVAELRKQGLSLGEIARLLQLPRGTVQNWLGRGGNSL